MLNVCLHVVEFPAVDASMEIRSRVGNGQYRSTEDSRADTAHWKLHSCSHCWGDPYFTTAS